MKKALSIAALLLSQSALALPLQNTGFETNNVSGSFTYGNSAGATGWNLTGGAGISSNSQAWSGYTPFGDFFAFLQLTSSATQSFTVASSGTYDLEFYLRQRTNYRIGGVQSVSVLVDNNLVWSGDPADSWTQYGISTLALSAGSHTLAFAGTNAHAAGDTTAFVDNISLSQVQAVPEPATAALAGAALLFSLGLRRRA